MSKKALLLKNTIIYSIGNFSSKLLVFILLPVYTYYLTTKEYGYYDLIISMISLLVPLVSFQVVDGVYRYLLDAKEFVQRSRIVSSSLSILLINLSIFDIVFIILNQFIHIKYGLLICLYLNTVILFNFCMQLSRGLRRNTVYAFTGIITTAVNLIFNILFIVGFHYGVEGLLLSIIIANISGILVVQYNVHLFSYIKRSMVSTKSKVDLIKYSVPLIPNLLNWWVMNVSDRFIINMFLGLDANGIYALSNKFPSILIIINNIFYLAWQESAITEYKSLDRNKFYSSVFNAFMRIQFSSLFVLLSWTPLVIFTFFSSSYQTAYLYIPFLYIAVTFSSFSSFYGTGFQSSLETIKAFYSSIIGCIVNIVINFVTVPFWGIQGASLSTMLAFFSMWVIRIYQTNEYYTIKINKKEMLLYFVILLVFVSIYYINSFLLTVSKILISSVLFLVVNRDFILQLINKALNFRRKNS